MSEYGNYTFAKASLFGAPGGIEGAFPVPSIINPSEDYPAESIRSALGLLASLCGEDFSDTDKLLYSKVQIFPPYYSKGVSKNGGDDKGTN